MNAYKEITLGPEAIDYIRKCLRDGNTLASYLLQKLNLDRGRVVTFLSSEVTAEVAKQFTTGGKLPLPPKSQWRYTEGESSKWRMVPIPDTDSCLVTIIEAFLSAEEKRVCIFEDALSRPHDPILSRSVARLLTFNDEVYHFLSGRDVESSKIRQTIRQAKSIPLFIGAMTFIPEESSFSYKARKMTIASDELLRVLAERTEKIVVGAYDGEGYLIWNRA
jgi:hypothetical protein